MLGCGGEGEGEEGNGDGGAAVLRGKEGVGLYSVYNGLGLERVDCSMYQRDS